jgi:hypothetical protein
MIAIDTKETSLRFMRIKIGQSLLMLVAKLKLMRETIQSQWVMKTLQFSLRIKETISTRAVAVVKEAMNSLTMKVVAIVEEVIRLRQDLLTPIPLKK